MNWFRLSRKLKNNPLWLAESFTRGQAWVDLIMLANYKPGKIIKRGITVNIERGQLALSEGFLADRWQWSRNKVRRFLSDLETEQQIEQQKSRLITLICVKNYDKYQARETTESTTGETTNGTSNETTESTTKEEELITTQEERKEELNNNSAETNSAGVTEKVNEMGKKMEEKMNRPSRPPDPLHTPCKEFYLSVHPEHLWQPKDAAALNLLLKKIRHSIQSMGRELIDSEIQHGFELIIQHPSEWMKNTGKITIPDYASQYEAIVNQIKQGKNGKQKQYSKQKLEQAIDNITNRKRA